VSKFKLSQKVVFISKNPGETIPFGARGKVEEDRGHDTYMVKFEKNGYAQVGELQIVDERQFLTSSQNWPVNENNVHAAVRFFNETIAFLERWGWTPYDNGISAIDYQHWSHVRHEKAGLNIRSIFDALKDQIEKHIREGDLREDMMG
jgi:hypothetical protein